MASPFHPPPLLLVPIHNFVYVATMCWTTEFCHSYLLSSAVYYWTYCMKWPNLTGNLASYSNKLSLINWPPAIKPQSGYETDAFMTKKGVLPACVGSGSQFLMGLLTRPIMMGAVGKFQRLRKSVNILRVDTTSTDGIEGSFGGYKFHLQWVLIVSYEWETSYFCYSILFCILIMLKN